MTPEDREALYALLAQMRTLHNELTGYHAGVCVLHLEAAIAALESHLRRSVATNGSDHWPGVASAQAMS